MHLIRCSPLGCAMSQCATTVVRNEFQGFRCALTHKAAGSAALCILMIAGMLMDAQRRRKVNFLLDGQLHG